MICCETPAAPCCCWILIWCIWFCWAAAAAALAFIIEDIVCAPLVVVEVGLAVSVIVEPGPVWPTSARRLWCCCCCPVCCWIDAGCSWTIGVAVWYWPVVVVWYCMWPPLDCTCAVPAGIKLGICCCCCCCLICFCAVWTDFTGAAVVTNVGWNCWGWLDWICCCCCCCCCCPTCAATCASWAAIADVAFCCCCCCCCCCCSWCIIVWFEETFSAF